MNEMQEYRCYLGSAGWVHEEWIGGFYPEDLPAEWRLAFYNNFFNCVFLPHDAWRGADLAQVKAWVADTLERFRFVLEAACGDGTPEECSRLHVLRPKLGVLVDRSGVPLDAGNSADGRVIWLEARPDLRQLAGDLESRLRSEGRIYIIDRSHDLQVLREVKTLLEVMGL